MSRLKLLVCLSVVGIASLASGRRPAQADLGGQQHRGRNRTSHSTGMTTTRRRLGNGVCTLRAAIAEANNAGDLDTITFTQRPHDDRAARLNTIGR